MGQGNKTANIEHAYAIARETYSDYGVDTEQALARLAKLPISLHCWQGDDVGGFESLEAQSGGGIQATGNYPGKAHTPDQLRDDLEKVYSLLPGKHRLSLHAMYAETGGQKVDRTQLEPKHFQAWIDWAKTQGIGIDFNPTYFAHPNADDGFTLSHPDKNIREFWIQHGIASRTIAAHIGKELGTPSINNHWIPDAYKDTPVDRLAPRVRLQEALDAVLDQTMDTNHIKDAIESKLFGIGAESYTVGSHEFYMGYAISRKTLLCLDAGHFHPTEGIADKVSSMLLYVPELLLHVSRGVRWDSDHVVILSDELRAIAEEIVRHDFDDRIHVGLDFFDASINRIAAWVTGTRATIKALLIAMLEPTAKLRSLEQQRDFTSRLALLEEAKALPFGAVWDYYCLKNNVPPAAQWLDEVKAYENKVLSKR